MYNSNGKLLDFLIETKPDVPDIILPDAINNDINNVSPLVYQDYKSGISDSNRIIYYYQTFCGLQDIINSKKTYITHIHLASLHFGYNLDGTPYIHLNDKTPDDPIFDNVWNDLMKCKSMGIKIICMLGGAGGAFTTLFSNYDLFFSLLCKFIISRKDLIDGIDFDVEESIGLPNITKLIRDTMNTFDTSPNWKDKETGLSKFIITMAPVSYALEGGDSGMGGFSYKQLYQLPEGMRINYLNGQFYYGDFDLSHYKACISNGFPVNKIVMGCIENQFTDWDEYYKIIKTIKATYPGYGGTFYWEYCNKPSNWDKNVWVAYNAAITPDINNAITPDINNAITPDINNAITLLYGCVIM
jgi:hypothetical protein